MPEHTPRIAIIGAGPAGIAAGHELLKQVLDDNHEEVEWVSVRSRLRSQYSISGKDGKLDKKISRTDFPRSVGLYAASLIHALEPQEHTATDKGIWKRLFGK